MHKDEIQTVIEFMLESVELVEKRFSGIRLAEDFVLSPDGVTLLDSITMRLQVISRSSEKNSEAGPRVSAIILGYRMGQTCPVQGFGIAPLRERRS
jgi:hypothetical protein